MFADAPVVEMLMDSDPSKSLVVAKWWKEIGEGRCPPYPLQGRLEDWVAENENTGPL
jgi:hypothetical protein